MATVADLQERLTKYQNAETAILAGYQSFTVDGTTFTRSQLSDVRAEIERLEMRLSLAQGGHHGHVVFGSRR